MIVAVAVGTVVAVVLLVVLAVVLVPELVPGPVLGLEPGHELGLGLAVASAELSVGSYFVEDLAFVQPASVRSWRHLKAVRWPEAELLQPVVVCLLEPAVVVRGFAVALVEIVAFQHCGPVNRLAVQAGIVGQMELVRFVYSLAVVRLVVQLVPAAEQPWQRLKQMLVHQDLLPSSEQVSLVVTRAAQV